MKLHDISDIGFLKSQFPTIPVLWMYKYVCHGFLEETHA